MPHGDTVVNGDGVELGGETTLPLYLLLDHLAYLVEMGMAGDKLGE